jgi:hypothetical protein
MFRVGMEQVGVNQIGEAWVSRGKSLEFAAASVTGEHR